MISRESLQESSVLVKMIAVLRHLDPLVILKISNHLQVRMRQNTVRTNLLQVRTCYPSPPVTLNKFDACEWMLIDLTSPLFLN